jgi:hypothetical protein
VEVEDWLKEHKTSAVVKKIKLDQNTDPEPDKQT